MTEQPFACNRHRKQMWCLSSAIVLRISFSKRHQLREMYVYVVAMVEEVH